MRYIIIVGLFLAACNKPDAKTQFDNLEKVFEAANWRLRTVTNDTFYMFFSRENPALYKVYSYMLENGDSVNTVISTIEEKNGEIRWDLRYHHITLKDASDRGSTWYGEGVGNVKVNKFDSTHISFHWGEDKRDTLVRTLPISAFLVRAKQDFLHGR